MTKIASYKKPRVALCCNTRLFICVFNVKHIETSETYCTSSSDTITGTSTDLIDGSYHGAVLYGKIAVIADLTSDYAGGTFREGYSSADWGSGEFGRAMFKAVYDSDLTPTGWT